MANEMPDDSSNGIPFQLPKVNALRSWGLSSEEELVREAMPRKLATLRGNCARSEAANKKAPPTCLAGLFD
jgi:hypothetical protein